MRNGRSSGLWLVLLLLALWLPGCGQKPSFSSMVAENTLPAPPISLAALDGLPPQSAAQFTEAMRKSARARGITLVQGDFSDGLKLEGIFGSLPQGGEMRINYDWRLASPAGEELMRFSGSEQGAGEGDFPPALLERVAEAVTETLASKLLALGFSTRAAGMPPPPEAFRYAGPDAHKDIDYETLLGPGVATDPLLPPVVAETVQPDAAGPADLAPAKKPARGPAIKAIALLEVKGAPGRGNAELRAAMKKVLTAAGWPVVDKPAPDALSVAGVVEIKPPQGASQRVSLAWIVKRPDGSEVGAVRQANDVPAGSLNTGWGETADFAAQAAAAGLADLVQSLR